MNRIFLLAGGASGALLLSSCVTYPYESAFSSCESEADQCYRICEDIPDEGGYIQCQSHCDRDADRCFDQAYSPYASGYGYGYGGSGGYGYGSPWYGRYGSWYPDYGFALSFNNYDRYGYRHKRRHPGDNGWNDNDHRPPPSNGNSGNSGPRTIDRPRAPNRYYQRSTPPQSAPAAPAPQREFRAPPSRPAAPPPAAPTYTPPPTGGQPAYVPPPASNPPPSPPPAVSPPPGRPARSDGLRGERSGPAGEPVDRDLD